MDFKLLVEEVYRTYDALIYYSANSQNWDDINDWFACGYIDEDGRKQLLKLNHDLYKKYSPR